jgi:hypothetical protein
MRYERSADFKRDGGDAEVVPTDIDFLGFELIKSVNCRFGKRDHTKVRSQHGHPSTRQSHSGGGDL